MRTGDSSDGGNDETVSNSRVDDDNTVPREEVLVFLEPSGDTTDVPDENTTALASFAGENSLAHEEPPAGLGLGFGTEIEMTRERSYSGSSPATASPTMKVTLEGMNVRNRLSSAGLMIDSDRILSQSSTKQRFVHKQQLHLVLEFKSNRDHRFVEMRRDDVLQEARAAIPPIDLEKDPRIKEKREELERVRSLVASKLSPVVSDEDIAQRVRLQGTLQHRDVRLLDSTFTHSRDPAILVRRHAILVNLAPIKALLFHNRTLIFVPDGADLILSSLMARLQESSDNSNPEYSDVHVPFVIRSLEAIFLTICKTLDDEATQLEPRVHETVSQIVMSSSGVTIERLRQAKSSVSLMHAKLQGIQRAFEELLESDRDMALMKLEKVYNFPHFYVEKNSDSWSTDHEEIELLLENYAQAIDGTVSRIEALSKEIDSAMSTISLRLDTARNRLLGVDLLVTSVTSAAAIGALFAGLFGMNLDSGVQEEPYWFWIWFGVIVGGVPVAVTVMFWSIYRNGLLIT